MWDSTLEELGVPAVPPHSNHAGLETTDAIAARLEDAQFEPVAVWQEDIEHTFEPHMFWRLRTEHGTNSLRLLRLDGATRRHVLSVLERRLADLDSSDYTMHGTLVCAVARKPASL